MDLKELFGSRQIAMRKEDYGRVVGSSPENYKELVALAFSKDMPACWRATWIMDYLSELYPELPVPHISNIWKTIPDHHPDGVTRSALRMLARYPIPGEFKGIATDLCLDWLVRDSVPVAIKAFSMEILLKIAKEYPELKDEFISILEDHIPNNSVGFKARAVHIIKALGNL